jgi:hypothetical protein
MGVLVDNTITKVNNHFGPYCDNEAESTHDMYHAGKVCRFHCEHSVYVHVLVGMKAGLIFFYLSKFAD